MKIRFRQLIIFTSAFLVLAALLYLLYTRQNGKRIPSLPEMAAGNKFLSEQVKAARKKAVHSPSAENIGELGMIYNSAELYDEAAKCYALAISKDPSATRWRYYLGYLNLELGNSDKAIEAFRNVAETPAKYMACYYIGSAWESINVPDSAQKYFNMAGGADSRLFETARSRVNFFPLPVYAKYRIASLNINMNRLDLAEAMLKDIIHENVSFGPGYRQLSNLYSMKGDSAKSRYFATRANDLTIFTPPPDPLIDNLAMISRSDVFLMKQIDMAMRSANSKWAVDLLRYGLAYFSDNKYFLSKAVKEFLSVGMSKEAQPYLDRHLSFFSDDSGELLETARLLGDAGLKEEAGKYLTRVFQNSSNNTAMQSEVALLFVQKGMVQQGTEIMSDLLKREQKNAKIISDAAFMYLELNDRENTMKYIDLLRHLSPGDTKLKILGAIIAEKEGKTEEAASLYEKVFINDPKNIYVIDHLSNIYLVEKQWGRAVAFLRKALAVYPNSSALQEKLGGLLVACPDPSFRNITEGKEFSERAFFNYNYTVPVRISAGRNLAIACNSLGDNKSARSYISQTISIAENVNTSKNYMENLKRLLQEFSN